MKWVYRAKLILLEFKSMLSPDKWQIFKENGDLDSSLPIDDSQIFTIVFTEHEVIVVYINRQHERFIATPNNIATAHRILAKLNLRASLKQ